MDGDTSFLIIAIGIATVVLAYIAWKVIPDGSSNDGVDVVVQRSNEVPLGNRGAMWVHDGNYNRKVPSHETGAGEDIRTVRSVTKAARRGYDATNK